MLFSILLLLLSNLSTSHIQIRPEDKTFVHDPSGLVKQNDMFYIFHTGKGITWRNSSDLNTWSDGRPTLKHIPEWIKSAVPGNDGTLWAPDVFIFNGIYQMYYAVSTFGSQISCIGMATNIDLQKENEWLDQGFPILCSKDGDNFNAIDPHVGWDNNKRAWLIFGSFWSGIKITQLHIAIDGKSAKSDSHIYSIARHNQDPNDIEASWFTFKNPYYYIFVNWGFCCRGVNSTYNIRVGRSTNITGSYLDKEGIPMTQGGGTLFLGTYDRFIGPGQLGIYQENNQDVISMHFYDRDNNGIPTLRIGQLRWNEDQWPSFHMDPNF